MALGGRHTAGVIVRPLPLGAARPTVATGSWLLASLAFLLRYRGTALIVAGAIDAVLVVLMIGFVALARTRMMLTLRDGELILSRLRGTRLVASVGDEGRVVEVEVAYGPAQNSWHSRIWMIVAADGTVALRLNRLAWDRDQLEGLRTRLGLPLEVVQPVLPAVTARQTYPGLVSAWAVSWWMQHPKITAIVILFALMSIGIGIRG